MVFSCFASVLHANPSDESAPASQTQEPEKPEETVDEGSLPVIKVVAIKPKKITSPFLGGATQNATVHEPFQRRIFDLDNHHKNTKITVENDTLGINLDEETGLVYFTADSESQIGTHNIQFIVKTHGKTFHHHVDFIVSEPDK